MAFKISYSIIALDKFSAISRKISSSVAGLGRKFDRLSSSLARSSQGMKKFSGANGVIATRVKQLGTLLLGATGIRSILSFGSSMSKVEAITNESGEALSRLRAQAKKLGAQTIFTAGQAADAMSELAVAGLNTEQIFKATPKTLQLAAAAQIDLKDATQIVTSVMAGFGKKADELGNVNDVLVATFTSSKVNLLSLGEAMKFAGPVAKGMGLSFSQTTAILGAFGNAGFEGSLGGTALRGALVKLATPTNQARKVMKKLGLQFSNSTGELKPFIEITEELKKSGASTAQMMQIFGLRAGPAMVALVNEGLPTLKKLSEKLKNVKGRAAQVAEVMQKNLLGDVKAVTSAFEGLILGVGDQGLSGGLRSLVQAGTDTLRWLQRMSDEFPRMTKFLIMATGTMIALKIAAFALGGALGFLSSAMVFARGVALAFNVALFANPIGLVIGAIAIGIAVIAKFNDTFRELVTTILRFVLPPSLEKLFGLAEKKIEGSQDINVKGGTNATADVNINLSGNTDAVKSVTATKKGPAIRNVGINMPGAAAGAL